MWMAHNDWSGWVAVESAVIVGLVLFADAVCVAFGGAAAAATTIWP